MKEGLFFENGELVYYKKGYLYHAGVIEWEGNIYYIGSKGRAVKGQHVVHESMANGLLKKGIYTFGEDYKLVEGSYIAPKKETGEKGKKTAVKKNTKTKRKRRKKKYTAKDLAACLAVLVCVICLMVVAYTADQWAFEHSDHSQTTTEDIAKIHLPTFDEEVLLCSGASKQLYDGKITAENAVGFGDIPYRAFAFEYQLGGRIWGSSTE